MAPFASVIKKRFPFLSTIAFSNVAVISDPASAGRLNTCPLYDELDDEDELEAGVFEFHDGGP
jgi:hypothetical protein